MGSHGLGLIQRGWGGGGGGRGGTLGITNIWPTHTIKVNVLLTWHVKGGGGERKMFLKEGKKGKYLKNRSDPALNSGP